MSRRKDRALDLSLGAAQAPRAMTTALSRREDSESSSAGAAARGGGAPRATI